MIDTVSLTQPLSSRLLRDDFLSIGAHRPKGQTQWVINPEGDQASAAITFQTQPDKIQYMTVRQSLPRLRHKHNALLQASQAEIDEELNLLSDVVYKKTGIWFDPFQSNVTGVHFTRDVKIGSSESINSVLKNLKEKQLSRFMRVIFDHGVLYKQKETAVEFYSKYHEVCSKIKEGEEPQPHQIEAMKLSSGALRVETKLTSPAIRRLIDQGVCESRAAKNVLTKKVSDYVVSKALDGLQFEEARKTNPNKTFEILIRFYGAREAMRLYGFLMLIELYGKNFWMLKELNFSRNTYFNNRKKCRDAGLLNS